MIFFVDITGIDGSGKSTVSRVLKDKLLAEGVKCEVFHGYVPRNNMYMLKDLCIKSGIGHEESRRINTLGMAAALMDVYCNTKKIFSQSKFDVVIFDKYIKDSVVYMPLLGGEAEVALIYEKNMPVPNIRFILDVDPYTAHKRVVNRSSVTGKRIQEKESIEIMIEAREKFLEFKNEYNTYVIDANRDVELVINDVYQMVKELVVFTK